MFAIFYSTFEGLGSHFFCLFFSLCEKGLLFVVRMSACLKKTQFDSSVQWVKTSKLYCLVQRTSIRLLRSLLLQKPGYLGRRSDSSLRRLLPAAPAHVNNKGYKQRSAAAAHISHMNGINRAFINRFYFSGGLSCVRAVSNAANRRWLRGLGMTCICSLLGLGEFVLVAVVIVLAEVGAGRSNLNTFLFVEKKYL